MAAKIKTLPSFNFTIDDLDCSQRRIVAQLQKYLDFKKSKMSNRAEQADCVLPFSTTKGLCSGLSAYWMYCKCTEEEWEFLDKVEYLLTWDKTKVAAGAKEDRKIEDFMNAIELLQFDVELRPDVRQVDIDQSFKVLLPKNAQQVAPAEFQSSFVFTEKSLQEMLNVYVQPNKMIRLSNNYHVISLVYTGGIYYLYDPESKQGPKPYNNTSDLANAIFKSMAVFNKSEDPIALNMSVFDLQSEPKAEYSDPKTYYQELLSDPVYKQALIANPHIFDLAMLYKDEDLARYLIKEGMDLNLKTLNGIAPLEAAVLAMNPSIIFSLLANGANPNIPTSKSISLLELAFKKRDMDSITMLLAFGIDFTAEQMETISAGFKHSQYKAIVKHAIELNKKLLHVPELLNLNTADGRDIVAFLRNCKLKIQLDRPIDSIEVKINGRKFVGVAALNKIIEHCHESKNLDLFDCAQKTEILELLKYHLPADFKNEGDQELLQLLSDIEKNISDRDLTKLSKLDLQEIAIILDHLNGISSHWTTLYPKRLYICYRATAIKHEIERQLSSVGIDSIKNKITELQQKSYDQQRNYLFFTPDKQKTEPEVSFKNDVAPLLKT